MAQADASSEHPSFDLFCDDREWQFLLLPHLLPLNQMIQESGYPMEDFFEPVLRFDESVVGQTGVRYGLPLRLRSPFVFFRSDLVEEIPPDWDEYERMLERNTGAGRYGLGVEVAVYPYHPFGYAHDLTKLFLARYWSFGQPLLTDTWEPLVSTEIGVEALEMLRRQVARYAPPDVLSWDAERSTQAFIEGAVTLTESTGVRLAQRLRDCCESEIGDCWSVAAFPGNSAPCTLQNMMICRHSRHPKAAFDFMAYCTGPDAARRLHLDYGELSARAGLCGRLRKPSSRIQVSP